MESFHVGQVVFVFLREEHRIAPVQIVEEVVRRKLGGEEVKYFVRMNMNPKSKVVPLELEKERVFLTIEAARQYMVDNATKAINGICEEALKVAASFAPAQEVERNNDVIEDIPTYSMNPSDGYSKVRLPTGEIVNVKV